MAYSDIITNTANAYGVPPSLALAVATQESGINQSKIGAAGEIGIFQLKPSTAADLGVDPNNPVQNIDGGVAYLAQQYKTFGSWDLAVAAYNAGARGISSGIPSSTQAYVNSVMGRAGMVSSPSADLASLPNLDVGSQPIGISAEGLPIFSTDVLGSSEMDYSLLLLLAIVAYYYFSD